MGDTANASGDANNETAPNNQSDSGSGDSGDDADPWETMGRMLGDLESRISGRVDALASQINKGGSGHDGGGTGGSTGSSGSGNAPKRRKRFIDFL